MGIAKLASLALTILQGLNCSWWEPKSAFPE